MGLLIDERPGTRGAGSIGIEIFQFPVFRGMGNLKEGRVLAPQDNYCSHIRHDEENAKNLADGFEFVKRSQFFAELLTVVAGEGNGTNRFLAKSLVKISN